MGQRLMDEPGDPGRCCADVEDDRHSGVSRGSSSDRIDRGQRRDTIRTAIFEQMSEEHIDFMLSKIPMGRFGLVEEAAAMIVWLASEDCAFSTGAVFDISGGRATY